MELSLPLILDGATGTRIQAMGFTGETTPEEWVLSNPEKMISLQKGYIDCGSNIVYAPTFTACAPSLEGHKIFGKVKEFNRGLVGVSKKAAGNKALVAGDMTTCGLMLYPMGDATFEEMYEVYLEQATALESAGVDLFIIETMTSIPDTRAAILACKAASKKPVFVTFSVDENGRTMMGNDILAALFICQGMGVDAFGLNCSAGPDMMLKQIKRIAPYAAVPLIAKPNAGLPQIVDGKTVYNCPADEFVKYTEEFAACGVRFFGGCCGTNDGHIRALAQKVKETSFPPFVPAEIEGLPCATQKEAFILPFDITVGDDIDCIEELEEILEEYEGNVICLNIADLDAVQCLADAQLAIDRPLCIKCDDTEVLEQALRVFQGRAMYEGSLNDADLLPLAEKYGLII